MDLGKYLQDNGLVKKIEKELTVEKLTNLVRIGKIKETITGIKIGIEKKRKG